MTQPDRVAIADTVASLPNAASATIITHGTDTMVETGLFLLRRFRTILIPIIFTGSMTPLGFEGSDGLQNLTESLLATRLLSPGVYLVMHNQIFPIDRVRKDKTLSRFMPIEGDAS